MLISESYQGLNEQLHESNKNYGTSGGRWAAHVLELAKAGGTEDVLDYGCGKSTLAANLPFDIKQYDPAIPKYSARPEPADLVVCGDVLEHIEPECLNDVLDDLHRVTKGLCFMVIHSGKAQKTLADGRNAHLIIEDEIFWLGQILRRFVLKSFAVNGDGPNAEGKGMLEYIIVGVPRQEIIKGDIK